ncbi:unnamed protein product [Cyprideis torosa]|uniref:Uncharacterized protein n=1 Tax=Cyprideis torosa TaxID=163714 RepID=A0A7R8WS42_9CRUS|nr:unnamed protein product [Cyprideis torosa]CAG0909168.1 unnamed protein product [Cyprideis torosa]
MGILHLEPWFEQKSTSPLLTLRSSKKSISLPQLSMKPFISECRRTSTTLMWTEWSDILQS